MIVDPYSVVAVFASIIEAALGVATLAAALAALRHRRGGAADAGVHLPILLALTLAAVSIAGWPLFYLALQSYVGRWPGIMCIQGVTRVGTGSEGAAGALPSLVAAVSALRPAAVFVAGGWLALHVANRRTRTAPFTNRVLAMLAASGALCLAAGAAETAYLLIPKAERFLADGCCTVMPESLTNAREFRPFLALFGEGGERIGATTTFFAAGAALLAAVVWAMPRGGGAPRRGPLLVASICGFAYLAATAAFASDVAAPVLLRLPLHRCAWCLFALVPETIVGAALVVLGVFATGWAALAAWCAVDDDSSGRAHQVRVLLRAAAFGYAGALVLVAVEMLLA